jgi:hypothetical protein
MIKQKIINLLDKFIKWLTQLKTKLEAEVKKEVSKVETEVKVIESRLSEDARETAKQVITDTQDGEKFFCHYCRKAFTFLKKDVFPVSVPMLYKESYVQGKGVLCPHCQKTCITG